MASDRRERRRVMAGALWFAGIVLCCVLGGVIDLFVIFPNTAGPGSGAIKVIEIPSAVGLKQLAEILRDGGLLTSSGKLRMWLRMTGRLAQVRAGVFELRDDISPSEIFDALSSRSVGRGVRVTVPEGFTLSRIAGSLERAGIASFEQFFLAAGDRKLLTELGIPGQSAEGYLFPDTYYFAANASAEDVVRKMHANFERKLEQLGVAPAGVKDLVILASIVQAEARVVGEMPSIAGVYHNRLQSPEFPSRLLNADPTVAYGCEPGVTPRAPSCDGFTGTLGRRQLDDKQNPYNTYRHSGMPPGPICAAGLDALAAAQKPKSVPYFYFVARRDRTHEFSITLEEHQAAVARHRDGG